LLPFILFLASGKG